MLAFKLNRLSANATLDHMKNHQAWSSKAVLGPVLPAILATVIFAVFGRGVMINRKQSIGLILSLLLCLALHGFGAELKNQEPAKILPVPGEVFEFHGHIAFLIPPRQTTNAIPWVWYAPTLPDLPGATTSARVDHQGELLGALRIAKLTLSSTISQDLLVEHMLATWMSRLKAAIQSALTAAFLTTPT